MKIDNNEFFKKAVSDWDSDISNESVSDNKAGGKLKINMFSKPDFPEPIVKSDDCPKSDVINEKCIGCCYRQPIHLKMIPKVLPMVVLL